MLVVFLFVFHAIRAACSYAQLTEEWILRRSRSEWEYLDGVTFGNGLFIVTGALGVLLRSSDAITWTTENPGSNFSTYKPTFVNGYYLVLQSGNNATFLLDSSDGITWNRRSKTSYERMYAMAYGNEMLVAVGSGSGICSSTDYGVSWNPVEKFYSFVMNDVIYANSQFVACGYNGEILTSSDGTTWTVVTRRVTSNRLNALAYGNGVYVAVGEYGTVVSSGEGITWLYTIINNGTSVSPDMWGIVFAEGHFLAVDANGLMYGSEDGSLWSRQTYSPLSETLLTCNQSIGNHLGYGDGKFVVVGCLGTIYSAVGTCGASSCGKVCADANAGCVPSCVLNIEGCPCLCDSSGCILETVGFEMGRRGRNGILQSNLKE